ncbi:methyl-accepting chemotaxis protein [Pelagicoccus sp. SDUM812003]|uniref:methyl-accepting chemotaxis protein n=1 Tax=Pelagicoccus sp. SDUM812003 TaxID=3041267 RepID=UPI00280F442D|nr:methyl-accepting chemotaxis protein [Pelagicoccus sp. SDUM812003]MDQ8203917.1 methyl-accepting chemotaxis protein [Pelagicoccus sp. SDUM812003]
MNPPFPLRRKLFFSHFLATFFVSSAVGVIFYLAARDSLLDQLRARLSGTAAMISREIDANELRDVRFERDVSKREYVEALESLRQMRRSNADVAYLYVMRLDEDGRVRFVVDSDESEDQALPGRVYESATPRLMLGFTQQSADEEFVTDAWGTFLSGYAPTLNSKGEFLVGIDMNASEVRNKLDRIKQVGAASIVIAVLLSWVIASWMSRHFRQPIEAIIEHCQAVGAGDLDKRVEMQRQDEMDSLLVAVNAMTEDLRKARDDNMRLAESLDDALDEDRRR